MIFDKLKQIESEAKNNIDHQYQRIEAVRKFKELLNEIDFSSEVIPVEDAERLARVLTSLKGKQLSRHEKDLIEELIEK